MDISIIICTRNRADDLAQTLDAFKSVEVPGGASAEIIVADNASSDHTREVAQKQKPAQFAVRYLLEERPGKMWAQNSGMAAAQGTVILTTDDDVRPAKNWLEKLTGPLLTGQCDAAVGRIIMAEELRRPWMTENYAGGIAWYDGPQGEPLMMVGANMGFHRDVLKRVPAFDVELGPGALGFHDDSLFGWQLAEAGFRLRYIPEASVVHCADASRLSRRNCLAERRRYASSLAYVHHHWRHERWKTPRLRYLYLGFKLIVRRLLQPPPPLDAEGLPIWEASYVCEMQKNRQFLIESRRPRNYDKKGLIKRPTD